MIDIAIFLQVLFFTMVCFGFFVSRSASFFNPIALYLIFHFLVFVLRPLMVYALDFDFVWRYMRYRPTEQESVETLLLSSFALLVIVLAAYFAGRCRPEFSATQFPALSRSERSAFALTALILGPFAVYSGVFAGGGTTFDVSNDGGIEMTRDLATGIAVYTNTTGYIAQAHSMLGALCFLALWRFNFRPWAYLPFVMFIAYRAFLGWGRWSIITGCMSLVLLYLYRNKIKWFRLRYLLIVIPMVILFQNLGMNRDLVRDYVQDLGVDNRVAEVTSYNDSVDKWKALDHPDFANYEFLAYVKWAVPAKSQTYTYFTQYLQLFTEPIPRILWKEKPIGAPVRLINLNDYGNFVGMTTSLAGDGWMSWGWFGVALTMLVVGLILGRMHKWFWRSQDNPRAVMAYCVFLPLTIQWFRDGGISIAKFALFSLFPIILWIFLSRAIAALEQRYRPQGAYHRRPPPGGWGRQ